MQDNFRAIVKQFFPYCVQTAYMRHTYGICEELDRYVHHNPFVRAFLQVLPYGFVHRYAASKPRAVSDPLKLAEKLGLFDSAWYLKKHPELSGGRAGAWRHFTKVGWLAGDDPSPEFSVNDYLRRYADVRSSGMNPLLHFINHGRFERRRVQPTDCFRGGEPTRADRRAARRRESDPFFSVVVASYNYEKLVVETLESLVNQTYRNFEIVVVDDGSPDGSVLAIEKFIADHKSSGIDMRLLQHEGGVNRGLPATVRLGVESARGEFVAFCESDDLWTSDHLAELAAFIRRYGTAEIIVNDVEIFGDPVRVAEFSKYRAQRCWFLRHSSNRISPVDFRKTNYILTFSATAVRREALLSCDFNPVERPAALDWWLWRQLAYSRPIHYLNRRLTKWRMHDSYMFKSHASQGGAFGVARMQAKFTAALDKLLVRRHPLFALRLCFAKGSTPSIRYRFGLRRHWAFLKSRREGLREFAGAIRRNRDAKILVCLHLFYEGSWRVIRRYLDNLRPYSYDLVVTCPEGIVSESAKARILRHSPHAKILTLPNRGYDVGPFVESLKAIDLDDYEIVFKLQSKGVKRPRMYLYGQFFKYRDWFFNLFDGVLGGRAVHQAIDEIRSGRALLVAADNLIVEDPPHKKYFMRRFCEAKGLPFVENYRFVAGTCMAVAASALKPLQAFGASLDDFELAAPGEFTMAHALERWMCFAAADKMFGVLTPHPEHPKERDAAAARSALRLLDDPRFKIDYDFFYRVLETRPIKRYEVVEIRLAEITRYWNDGVFYSLEQCPPYRYLCGDESAYTEYCHQNESLTGFKMSPERFEELCRNMKEYDPLMMPVVRGSRNIIIDGQHRSCILLKKFGPDHRIKVLRLF